MAEIKMPDQKTREKYMMFAAGAAVLLFVYWHFLLNPLLVSIDRNNGEINGYNAAITKHKAQFLNNTIQNILRSKNYKLYGKDEELSYVLESVYNSAKDHNVKLLSLNQTTSENRIYFDIEIESSYDSMVSFLSSLKNMQTYLAVMNLNMYQSGDHLKSSLRLSVGYK